MDATKKLKQFMRYLQLKKFLPLTLEDNGDMHVIKWLANGSYGVHSDMKSDTGATMSLGI